MQNNQQPIPPLKIVCISDTNGDHSGLLDLQGDILIHCGDFTRSGTENEFYEFINLLPKLRFKHKILIAGHKELTFDTEVYESKLKKIFHHGFPNYDGEVYKSELMSLDNVYYLEHEYIELEGIKFFGSPFQPDAFDMAFGRSEEELRAKWEDIVQPMDILVTHFPPYGVMDDYKGTKTGCPVLAEKVKQLKPRYHIFGHNREEYGQVQLEGVRYINCCRFNKKFKPENPPVEILFVHGSK